MDPGKQILDSISTQRAKLGTVIADRYELVSLLAEGGMGAVYKARHIALDKTIAVKVLKVSEVGQDVLQRFTAEAKAAAALNHPNLMAVHDYGQLRDGSPYLVMEYVEGETLSAALKNTGPFEEWRAIRVFTQICDGLAHAHARGVIHRDLKPANIVLVHDGDQETVKIVDFGLAKRLFEPQHLTQTGQVFGTPLYMSPEQCTGRALDVRSDIYSLGVLMFEALTGRPPLHGETPVVTMFKHLTETPPRINSLRPHAPISEQTEEIIFHCLAKNPNDRFQTVAELRQHLASLLVPGTPNIQHDSAPQKPSQLNTQQGETVDSSTVNSITAQIIDASVRQTNGAANQLICLSAPDAVPPGRFTVPRKAVMVACVSLACGSLALLPFTHTTTTQAGSAPVALPPKAAAKIEAPRSRAAVPSAGAESNEAQMPPLAPDYRHHLAQEPLEPVPAYSVHQHSYHSYHHAVAHQKPSLFKRIVRAIKHW